MPSLSKNHKFSRIREKMKETVADGTILLFIITSGDKTVYAVYRMKCLVSGYIRRINLRSTFKEKEEEDKE